MSDQDPQSQLASYLCSQGLDDAPFWMTKFEEIGVKSLKSLPYVEGDDESLKGWPGTLWKKGSTENWTEKGRT